MFDTYPTRQRPAKRALHWGEYILLTVGFVCLGWVAYSYVESYVFQSYEQYTLEEMLRGRHPSVSGYVESLVFRRGDYKEDQTTSEPSSEVAETPAPNQPRRIARPANGLIGKIEIPRLQISAVVREGADAKTLKHAVGHLPETALPGENGNVAIAAHRDTFFRNLKGVRKGDRIHMVTPSGTYEYEVESTKIVLPTNVEVVKPTAEPAITLVTCYPFNYVGSAPKRFIVRGRQVTTEAKAKTVAEGS